MDAILLRLLFAGLALAATACQPRHAADAAAAAAPAAVAATPAERLSAAARALLAAVKETEYAHRTAIDVAAGRYVTDCSGLVSHLLERELPGHYAAIANTRGKVHPLAADFQEAFAAGADLWQGVPRIAELRPGDVLAWRYVERKPGASSGHVVIIDALPIPEEGGVWAVAVIDSTSIPHEDDTRRDGDGVGRGVIRLRAGPDGAVQAVRGTATGPFRSHAFAAARPVAAAAGTRPAEPR